MVLHDSVQTVQSMVSVAAFIGPGTAQGKFLGFAGSRSLSQAFWVLKGTSVAEQTVVALAQGGEVSTPIVAQWSRIFSPFPVPQPRRKAMLEVLKRLKALKAEMRQKYGEFNVDDDLEEMRNQRLAELG